MPLSRFLCFSSKLLFMRPNLTDKTTHKDEMEQTQPVQKTSARSGGAIWTPAMSLMTVAGLALAAAATSIDTPVTAFVRASDAQWIGWMAAVTMVGASQWYLVPAGVVFILSGVAMRMQAAARLRPLLTLLFGHAGFCFASIALSGIFTNFIKYFVGRARPRLFEQHGAFHFEPMTGTYEFVSFPSGHSTTIGAVAGILMLWCPRLAPLFALAALFFGATRIASRSHYPSDIITGLLIGLLFAMVFARLLASHGVLFRRQEGKLLPRVIGKIPRR